MPLRWNQAEERCPGLVFAGLFQVHTPGFTHYPFLFPENLSKEDFYSTLDQHIDIYIEDQLFLFHYNNTGHYDATVRSTTFFRHCRGMIINSEGKIVNLPFLRFLEFDYAD